MSFAGTEQRMYKSSVEGRNLEGLEETSVAGTETAEWNVIWAVRNGEVDKAPDSARAWLVKGF